MVNVAIYDPIRSSLWDYGVETALLRDRGVELVIPTDAAEAISILPSADVVVVSSKLPSDHLSSMARCCGILCYSVGMDGVDRQRAADLGIPVTNVPDYCTEEVSDHALALLYALQRQIVPMAKAAADGRWAVHRDPELGRIRRMSAMTVGVIGAGRIGSRVAAKCAALGMRVVAHDPNVTSMTAPGVPLLALDDLLVQSDAIILCAALTPESRHLIDAARLARLRPGSLIVNVARGRLIDEAALLESMLSGHIRAAALDVRETEPPPEDDPLRGLPNIVLTQHLGARSVEAHGDLHRLAAAGILGLLERAGRIAVASTSATHD